MATDSDFLEEFLEQVEREGGMSLEALNDVTRKKHDQEARRRWREQHNGILSEHIRAAQAAKASQRVQAPDPGAVVHNASGQIGRFGWVNGTELDGVIAAKPLKIVAVDFDSITVVTAAGERRLSREEVRESQRPRGITPEKWALNFNNAEIEKLRAIYEGKRTSW